MQAATSTLFDNLLRRADITVPTNAPKREFKIDDPRLWKNHPAFQLAINGVKRHLEQCRGLTHRIAFSHAAELERFKARANKEAKAARPTDEAVAYFARQIEMSTLHSLLKRSRTLRSRYVAH